MYDFYPEWGPARNRDGHPGDHATPVRRRRYWQPEAAHHRVPAMTAATAMAGGPEARDGHVDRPDDN